MSTDVQGKTAAVGVFRSLEAATDALTRFHRLGVPGDRIWLLTPDAELTELERIPSTDAEQPGIGAAIGAVVGGGAGVADETILEHETVEKRSMQVETVPPSGDVVEKHSTRRQEEHTGTQAAPARRRREHSSSEEETTVEKREPPPTVIERRRTIEVPPPPAVRERTYEETETK